MYEGKIGNGSERLLRVTAALYRVTGLLPAGEPLRTVLRECANNVLAECIAESHGVAEGSAGLESKIETLLGFIAVARALPDVRQENFFVLEREYRASLTAWPWERRSQRDIKTHVHRGPQDVPAKHEASANSAPSLVGEQLQVSPKETPPKSTVANERQRTILERLAQTPRVKVSDFYEIFQGISPKTIQRDLQDLVSRNVIKKEGEKRWTVYTRAESR